MTRTIDTFPNEILIKIFLLYEHPCPPEVETSEDGTEYRWTDAPNWVSLMGVCRHWRNVIVATPLLWQDVKIGESTKWLELALDRTQDAPLDIYIESHPTSVKALPMLMPHMRRVRKLLLHMPLADLPLLSSDQPATFPILDELLLGIDKSDEQRVVDYVPFDLSPTRVPALRDLFLECAVVTWTPAIVSKLQYLYLHACSPSGEKPPFTQFLDVLEVCRELVSLDLHHFISKFASPSPHHTTRTIRLPKLCGLRLGDAPDSIVHFIANVYIQETVGVSLEGWVEIIDGNLQHAFSSLFPDKCPNLPILSTIKEGRITLSQEDGHRIIAGTPGQYTSLQLRLSSKVDYDFWFTYHRAMLIEFQYMFRGVSLQVLRMCFDIGAFPLHFTAWIDLFTNFPTLQVIAVETTGDPLPILIALSALTYHRARPGVPLCPHLKRLELTFLRWADQQHIAMITALQRRAQRGLPRLECMRVDYIEDGAEKFERALERDRTTAGDFSVYVAEFDCSSNCRWHY